MSKGRKGLRKLGATLVAMVLVSAMVIGLVPSNTMAAAVADGNTAEGYEASLGNNISTEYAGRIWSDKSVYAGNAEFEMFGGNHGTVEKAADEDFLVAFSALGTSQAISGQTQAPVDVVFVIDTSGSMNDDMSDTDSTNRIVNTVVSLNDSIEAVMSMNPYTRVSVVAFSNTAEVLLSLGRYEKGTRTSGYGGNQTIIEDYFSLSGNSDTLYKHVIPEGSSTQSNSNRGVTGGTNIQMGLYTGMNVLATEDEVQTTIDGTLVDRVPTIILLSDGAPTFSSSDNDWWAPANNNNDGPGGSPYYGNGMKALMTGAYMKEQINANYNVDATLYTVGMGIAGLDNYETVRGRTEYTGEQDLAYMTLDPDTYWTADNSMANAIETAWNTYTTNDQNVEVDTNRNETFTFTHPQTGDIDDIDNTDASLNPLRKLVDDYYDADSASEVADVFQEIVSSISISTPQVPTELKGADPIDQTGYITYTDPIGEYMTVGDVKAIVYAGEIYTATNTTKTVTTEGNVTTYKFAKEIDSDIYGKQKLEAILIKVTKDVTTGKETLTVEVPASVIPVRVNTVELYSDGSVKSHTNNGAYPVRVIYSVNLKDEVKTTVNNETIIDVTKLSQEYIDANSNDDGTINFYSNLYTGENAVTVLDNGVEVVRSAGNATVEFEPSHSNPFYYMQENVPICTDPEGTTQASSDSPLADGTTYYYRTEYYNGTTVEVEIVARTGAQLKKTDIIEVDGYWYRAAGSPRLNRILEFEGTKTNNTTNTAVDFYAPTFQYATGSTDPYDGKYVIYLGNNGLLTMKASGLLEISKEVEIPEGLTPSTTEFEFTVNFNGNATLAGAYPYDVVDVDGNVLRSGTIADTGTITLSDGQKAVIRNLAPGVTYEVTENAVAGYKAEMTGNTGIIEAGVTRTAAFKNTYSVSSVTVPASAGFQGTKTIANRAWLNTDSFTFILESRRLDTPMPEGSMTIGSSHKAKEVTVSGVETGTTDAVEFVFGNITYESPGQYEYVISEKQPTGTPIAGMSYSGAMYTVVVNVSDNGLGALVAEVIMTQILNDAGESVAVPLAEGDTVAAFTNSFSATSVSWMPVGTKDYIDKSGANPITTGRFYFEVEAVDATTYAGSNEIAVSKEDAPLPNNKDEKGVSLVTNVDVEIAYEAIMFVHDNTRQDAGTTKETAKVYAYKFTEVIPDGANAENGYKANGMTYDANEYIVVVRVYLEDENVIVEPTYPENTQAFPDGTTPSRVVFFNTYEPAPTTVVLGGTKTLTGRDMKSGESFGFTLAAANDAAEEVTLPANASVTGGTDGEAVEFAFGEIQFTKPGTYQFEMKEVVPAGYVAGTRVDGVIYDTHSCIVTVEVEDNNGVLEATAPVYTGGASFANTYQAVFDNDDTVNLAGNKTLTGRNIINGEFTFSVEPQKIGNTDALAPMGDSYTTTSVNAGGAITLLRNVTYDKAGTYEYVIKEVLPATATAENGYAANGVKYDTTIYKYTVVVEDVSEIGWLNVTSETLQKSTDNGSTWETVDKVGNEFVPTFANTYSTIPAEREVPVMTKILDGYRANALAADEFQFTMIVEGTTLAGTPINNADIGTHITLSSDIDGPTEGVWGPIGNKAGTIVDDLNSAEIEFGTIKFHKEGIYALTFAEVEPDTDKVAGVTYTKETLVATFRVTDNGVGALVAELLSLYGNYSFTNEYTVTPETLQFEIIKQFTGRTNNEWLDSDIFEFEVVILDSATQAAVDAGDIVFPTAQGDNGIQKVEISNKSALVNEGVTTVRKVTTPEITINKPGVYKFRIREVAGKIVGINYDSTSRDIVITATDNGNGTMTVEYEIVSGTNLEFKNVYDARSTELSGHDDLVIRKNFEGRANNQWLTSDAFTFKLEAVSAADEKGTALDVSSSAVLELPTETTLTVDNSNKAYPHFGNIKFHQAGTYVFKVNEVIPQEAIDNGYKLNGITYDPTVYTVTVVVGDDYEEAALVVESVVYTDETGEASETLEFNNTYATDSVELVGETYLKVKKILTGRDWNDEDVFEFTLEAFDEATKNAIAGQNPTVIMENVTATITKAEQEKAFGDIVFKAAGTYKFQIKETGGTLANMTYDTHSVIVTVIVADDMEGNLVVTDGTNLVAAAPSYSGSMTFENVYTPTPVYATFNGNKVLNGRTLKAGEFRFHIEALTDGAPVPEQQTVANNAEGKFEFGQAIYTKSGVYEYQISEIKGNLAGVVYDESPVKVVVTVTYDSATGVLTPVVSYVKAGQPADDVEFVNIYTTAATDPVNISAVKTVTPSEGNTFVMNGDEFQFEIEPATSNPDSDPIDRALVKNSGDGSVLFGKAEYTEPGVYVYTVHEVDGNKGGITYDDTVYTITVTVVDDESVAKLSADVEIVKNLGETDEAEVGSIRFNNGYNPKAATAILHGHKYLTGGHKDLEANEFAFELKAVDYIDGNETKTKAEDTPMPDGVKGGTATVRNAETGLFQYGLITYDKAGVYAYEIREVNEGKTGYTYDTETIRRIIVTVTDTEGGVSTGVLKATVKGIVDSQGNPLATFTNEYVPGTTSASIGGTKKLTGRNMTVDKDGKGEFEFALLDSEGKEIRTTTNASAGETSAFTFASISYEKAGTYKYTVVEKNTNLSGVTYDLTTAYAVEVIVSDRDDSGAATGQLEATVKYYVDNEEVAAKDVVFNNSYKAASTTASFGAAKVLDGRTIKENEFTFVLQALTKDAPMPAAGGETAKNNAQGAVNFGEITFEKAGTYVYQISEVKGEDEHVTYDLAAHKVTVEVTDDLKGQLSAKVSGIEEVVFENSYKADPVEVTFGGKKELVKVLNGRDMKAEEFAFILKDSEGNVLGEALNNADGTFAFKGIIFKKAGSYNYIIEEKNTNVKGVTYDKGICYVHVEVVDDYEGNLIPTVTYGKDAKMDDNVVFTNSYKAASTSTQIGAVKKLAGRDMKAGEFKFVLEDEKGNKTYATNAADGTVLFDKITYTEAGTYVYKLYEEKGTVANVKYDDKVYTVTVVVEDNLNGALEVTSQFDAKNFVFNNVYDNPDTVNTGDATMIIPMVTMFILSAGCILVSLMKARKR